MVFFRLSAGIVIYMKDHEFEASPGYTATLSQRQTDKQIDLGSSVRHLDSHYPIFEDFLKLGTWPLFPLWTIIAFRYN